MHCNYCERRCVITEGKTNLFSYISPPVKSVPQRRLFGHGIFASGIPGPWKFAVIRNAQGDNGTIGNITWQV